MRYSQSGILKDTRPWGKMLVAGAAAVTIAVAMFASAFAATSVVTTQNMMGWEDLSSDGGEVKYTTGAPVGLGATSLELRTNNTNPAQAVYSHDSSLALSEVEQLSYWTKQVEASNVAGSASMFLSLDLDNDGDFDATLVHEPYWQNAESPDPTPVMPNVWQDWDVDEGKFWSTRNYDGALIDLVRGAGGPPFYTLAELQTGFPDAQVLSYGVNVGTWNPSYVVKVDGISVNGQEYDFETKDVCKSNGWKTARTSENKSFTNQGQCVSYFTANVNASFKKTE